MRKKHGNIKKILVPVPLSDELFLPLRQAMHFNRAYGTMIEILHIVSKPVFPRSLRYIASHKKNKSAAEDKLRSMVLNFFEGKIPPKVTHKVISGSLMPTILKEARHSKIDLIIIKKAEKNRSPFSIFRTENADKMISEAVCPVLTITQESLGDQIKDILIPVDIFKKTSIKVAWAISLAKQFQSRLHIVSVLSMDIKPEDSISLRKSKEIEETIRKEGIDIEMVILKRESRSIAGTVLDYANKINPDMLMIMTHQESLLPDNYLGSFASEIIHDSRIPVLSVVPSNGSILSSFFNSFKLNPHKPTIRS